MEAAGEAMEAVMEAAGAGEAGEAMEAAGGGGAVEAAGEAVEAAGEAVEAACGGGAGVGGGGASGGREVTADFGRRRAKAVSVRQYLAAMAALVWAVVEAAGEPASR